jgi:hypothetical protein
MFFSTNYEYWNNINVRKRGKCYVACNNVAFN